MALSGNTQNNFSFEIEKRLSGALGRAGVIHTPHGDIHTPAFVAVGTHGHVKFLDPSDLRSVGSEVMLSNAYHLRNKAPEISEKGGLATYNSWHGPTVTDSGGFQVMSLGSGLGKVVSMTNPEKRHNTNHKDRLATVTEEGVHFTDPWTGQPDFIGPEESMRIQCQIGADIHMAFDELTSLADTYEYNIEAMERTERWAERSLKEHKKHYKDLGYYQALYGVLQGGRWEDLRRNTARNLAKMDFDGYGLGGAFLKEDLGDILKWCNEELPENKPRHLLGLSHPDDLFVGAENGADTFDCVAPMREARHGKIYTKTGPINLRKCHNDHRPLDDNCACPTCQTHWTRSSLRKLWRSGSRLEKAKYNHLASAHNLYFITHLAEQIRESIENDTFYAFRDKFLKSYYNS